MKLTLLISLFMIANASADPCVSSDGTVSPRLQNLVKNIGMAYNFDFESGKSGPLSKSEYFAKEEGSNLFYRKSRGAQLISATIMKDAEGRITMIGSEDIHEKALLSHASGKCQVDRTFAQVKDADGKFKDVVTYDQSLCGKLLPILNKTSRACVLAVKELMTEINKFSDQQNKDGKVLSMTADQNWKKQTETNPIFASIGFCAGEFNNTHVAEAYNEAKAAEDAAKKAK